MTVLMSEKNNAEVRRLIIEACEAHLAQRGCITRGIIHKIGRRFNNRGRTQNQQAAFVDGCLAGTRFAAALRGFLPGGVANTNTIVFADGRKSDEQKRVEAASARMVAFYERRDRFMRAQYALRMAEKALRRAERTAKFVHTIQRRRQAVAEAEDRLAAIVAEGDAAIAAEKRARRSA